MKLSSQNEIDGVIDTLLLNAESSYLVDRLDTTNKYMAFAFVGENSKKAVVKFVKLYEEGNVDLEVSGKPYYYFNGAEAPFLDLFPFWKKYFEPSADMEKLLTNGRSIIVTTAGVNKKRVVFEKSNPGWIILVRSF